jgi:hypothetical protein
MTDLIPHSRPGMEPKTRIAPSRLPLTSALAAAACVGSGLVVCMAVALTGWFFADAGSHGDTIDALAVGVVVWLVGHGVDIRFSGAHLAMLPLGLTGLQALVAYRFARWAGRSTRRLHFSAPSVDATAKQSLVFETPKRSAEKTLVLSVLTFVASYVVIAVLSAVLIPSRTVELNVFRVVLGTLVMAALFGSLGLLSGTGALQIWWARVPGFIRVVLRGGMIGALLLVVASSLLVAVNLVLNFNQISAVVSGLKLSGGDLAMFALVNLALVPNAIAYGVAYLVGPGFAVGTDTVVSISQVDLSTVPALPWFSSLPEPGVPPAALLLLLLVPVVAGMIAAILAQRIYAVPALDSAALRGFGVGFTAAIGLSLSCWLAAGSLGDQRLAQIGPNFWEVIMTAGAAMSLGGLLGGLGTAWRQGRGSSD